MRCLTQIQAVYDQVIATIYNRGVESDAVGAFLMYWQATGNWRCLDVTQIALAEMCKASGIERSVLEAPAPDALRDVSQRRDTTI